MSAPANHWQEDLVNWTRFAVHLLVCWVLRAHSADGASVMSAPITIAIDSLAPASGVARRCLLFCIPVANRHSSQGEQRDAHLYVVTRV
eukprot:3363798-Alexandrium_andersonii.AAC.1